LECDLTNKEFNSQSCTESFASTKRPRKLETIDLHTPVYQRNTKKQEFRNESGNQYHSSVQTKGYKNNSSSYNLQEEGFYKSVFLIHIYIFRFCRKICYENKTAKNSKLTVVLLTLLALQLAPESIYLPKNEGRSRVEVAKGPIRNLRV